MSEQSEVAVVEIKEKKPRNLAAESMIKQLGLNFIRVNLEIDHEIVKKMPTLTMLSILCGDKVRFNRTTICLEEAAISQSLFEYLTDLVNKDEVLISVAPVRKPSKKKESADEEEDEEDSE